MVGNKIILKYIWEKCLKLIFWIFVCWKCYYFYVFSYVFVVEFVIDVDEW